MSRLRPSPIALHLALVALALAGCAGGDPASGPEPAASTGAAEFAPVPIVHAVSGDLVLADSPFMAVDVVIDPTTMQAEILPVRSAQAPPLGQKFTVNLMDLLRQDPCTDCIGVAGLTRLPNGNLQLDLGIRHPIAQPDLANGIGTAALHVTNVRGFVVPNILGPDGSVSADDPTIYNTIGFNQGSPLGYGDNLENIVPHFVANADGYSRDITPTLSAGTQGGDFNTIYPYVVFGASGANLTTGNFGTDGWRGSELENPTGYNVWAQGSTITGRYELALDENTVGTTQVSFRLVLTASYVFARKTVLGQLASKLDPLYFMPEGALMSPWRVTVENKGIDGAGAPPGEGTGALVTLDVQILDWQKPIDSDAIVTSLSATTSPTAILGRSWPGTVAVELPGILGTTVQRYDILSSTAAGTAADPITLSIPIVNNPSAASGIYTGFVRVEDERSNGAVLDGFDLYETGGVNQGLDLYNLGTGLYRYVTYQAFTYEVGDRPVRASIDYAAASAGSGRIVLDARTSSVDTPATIVAYDWVFDYTGNPGDFSTANISTTSPLFVGTPTYTTAGTHTLALRVTDSMARTDIVTTSITVKPLRDPFGSPDLITTIASNVTPMTFGVNSQDWSDGTAANPVGGSNFLQLGSNLYVVFYGKVGTNSEGLYFTRSTDNGATWQATPTLLAAKNVATFPQYGGAALTGARDGAGKDRLYVALGTISFAASGTGDILVFSHPDGGNTTSQPWSQTNVRSYALSATRSCACSPAIAVNPRNVNELHLVYGTDTGGTGVGINRRLEIKASTNGVAGLAADTAEAIDAATGPDSSWLTDTGTIYAVELAQHPVSEDIYLMLGANRNTYVLRSTNHGASYTKPLSSYNHGGPFFRDGDMVLDKWLPGEYYVARARRGTSTSIANNAVIHVLKGSNTSLTLLALPRDASETPTSLYNAGAEHVALGFHETGELEAFWTEAAGPAGALATHMSGPHIQHDLLPYNGSAWSYHPDRTGPDGTLNGLNPSVIPSSDGLVHVIWGSPAFNTISHRKG